jgi:hypothetical protein
VHLAHAEIEIDSIERDHAWEMLGETLRPQQYCRPGREMGGRVRVQRCRQQRQMATSNDVATAQSTLKTGFQFSGASEDA